LIEGATRYFALPPGLTRPQSKSRLNRSRQPAKKTPRQPHPIVQHDAMHLLVR
jgi:hypothetical protein